MRICADSEIFIFQFANDIFIHLYAITQNLSLLIYTFAHLLTSISVLKKISNKLNSHKVNILFIRLLIDVPIDADIFSIIL